MRKKRLILVLFCILVIVASLFSAYKSYGLKQANKYARSFVTLTHRLPYQNKPVITEDVQVVKIIKQTPSELVFLIKWGSNEKAYANIENWMTKAHDTIEVHVIDNSKLLVIYE